MTPRDLVISAALSIHAGCTQHVLDMENRFACMWCFDFVGSTWLGGWPGYIVLYIALLPVAELTALCLFADFVLYVRTI